MAYTASSLPSGMLEIGVAMVLHDRFTNQAREASGAIRRLHMDARAAVTANLDAVATVSRGVLGASLVLGNSLRKAILDTAPEFIDTMVSVKAISGATVDEFRELNGLAQSIGIKTMFTSNQIASGMKYLAMAGNSAKEVREIIEGATMVAGATGLDLAGKGGAADLVTNVMRAFKKEGKEAAAIVGDQLTKATLSANISITDLAQSVKYAAADLVMLKKDLPEVSAMIGVLGNAGIQGSMAGVALANMARYLNKSISDKNYKGFKYLQSVGLGKSDFVDAKGDLIDFGQILAKISDRTKDMSSTERNFFMSNVFGVRGQRAAITMMNNLDNYQDLLGKIINSNGTAAEVMRERMDSWAGSLNKVKSAAENLAVTFTQAVVPVLKPIVNTFAKVLSALRSVFDTPVIGPILASLVTFGTLFTISTAAASLFIVTIRRLKLNGIVSFSNALKIMTGRWKGVNFEAQHYSRILSVIEAQKKAGIFGDMKHLMAYSGIYATNRIAFNERLGRFYKKNGRGAGRFVSTAVVDRYLDRYKGKPQSLVAALVPGWKSRGVKTVGKKVATKTATTIASKSLLRTLGFGARGIFGMAMGPLGIGLSLVAGFLPQIISAIRERKRASDENTRAVKENTASLYYKRNEDHNLTSHQEITMLYNAIRYWSDQMSRLKPTEVTVVTKGGNGQVVDRQVVSGANSNEALNFGYK